MNSKENSVEKKKSKIWLVLLILFLLIFLFSAGVIVYKFLPSKNNLPAKYENSSKNVSSIASKVLAKNPIDFKSLKSDNCDVVAWIKVDGTVIDYPILMSGVTKEENFYNYHDINLKYKKAGCIFIQKINSSDFSDFNTMVYGHNMLNGTMFGTLKKFRNKEFFNKNRNIYIYLPGKILQYDIVSAFVHDDRHILNSYNFYTDEGKNEFIELCKNPKFLVKNIKDSIDLDTNDKLVTLSTCTSAEHERYLVVGKLIKETETD